MKYNEDAPVWTQGTRGEYNKWANAVKNRDNRCCVYCGSTEKLQAHHILSKHKHPEWSLFINNGITLCHNCHWAEHNLNGYL
jgi:5-methylcytosine-specific restriction endonuclease McrA